jgi:hypothetical protein
MTNSPPGDGRQTRPFADVLNSLRRGKTHREASSLLQELVTAVRDTGRQGTLTMKLKVSRNKAGMIEIDDLITTAPPKPDRDSSLYFADDEGNLSKDDPRQMSLPVGPVRVADATDGRQAQ